MFRGRAEGRPDKKLIDFARQRLTTGGAKGRKLTCEECKALYDDGYKKEYPCADCPMRSDPLAGANLVVWEIFCIAASATRVPKSGTTPEHDFYEIDWNLAVHLLNAKESSDHEEMIERLANLLKGLNSWRM